MTEKNHRRKQVPKRALSDTEQRNRIPDDGAGDIKGNQETAIAQEDNIYQNLFVYVESGKSWLASPLSTDNKPATHITLSNADTNETQGIQRIGDVNVFYELTPDNDVWLFTGGGITYVPQKEKTSTIDTIQYLGRVLSDGKLSLQIEEPIRLGAEIV
jgi:hypothetical protein